MPESAGKSGRPSARKRLGDLLLEDGVISEEQLQAALNEQRKKGGFIGQILVAQGIISQDTLNAYIVKQCKIPHLSLLDYEISAQALRQIPEEVCLRYMLLPIDKLGRILTVAMVDPLDTGAMAAVQEHCPDLRIKPMLCNWNHFSAVVNRVYARHLNQPADLDVRLKRFGLAATQAEAGVTAGKKGAALPVEPEVDAMEDTETISEEPLIVELEPVSEEPREAFAVSGKPAGKISEDAVLSLAVAVRESIRDGMAELGRALTPREAKTSRPDSVSLLTQEMRANSGMLVDAVQQALETTMNALAGELRQEREEMAAALRAMSAPVPTKAEKDGDTAASLQAGVSAALQELLGAVADQLREVGEAIRATRAEQPASPSLETLTALAHESAAKAAREASLAVADQFRELVAAFSERPASADPSPAAFVEVLRDQVGAAMTQAMSGMAEHVRELARAQQRHMEALPAPPDFQAAALLLQDTLNATLERALDDVSRQFRGMAEDRERETRREVGVLAEALRESVQASAAEHREAYGAQQATMSRLLESLLESLGKDKELQREQQAELAKTVESALGTVHRDEINRQEQQAELARVIEAALAAIAQDKVSRQEQQEEMARVVEAALSAVSREKDTHHEQQAELARVLETALAAISRDKEAQEARQAELARHIIEAMAALTAEREGANAAQAEMPRIAEAIIQSMENDKAVQEERQAQLAHIAEAALESVRQTAQLIEAQAVAENTRNDLARRRQAKHASVAPFPGLADVPADPAAYEESDGRIRGALESDQPLPQRAFDNFFPGEANDFTFKLGKAVADNPGGEYNPFFLYGKVGTGKTHLISAIGNAIIAGAKSKKNALPRRVGYVSASHFAWRMAAAAADGALEMFRDNYCHWDVLILDDIQFMGGRVEAQEEFFHIFNVLQQAGRQIIIAGDKAPDRLGLLEQRLVSRFAGGIVAELKAPEWETRMRILRHLVEQTKTPVPEEVLAMISMRVPDDVRKMTGAARKIMAYATLDGNRITMETAQRVLSHLGIDEAA